MILLTESQLKLLIERQGDLDFIKSSNEIFNVLLKFTSSLDEIKKGAKNFSTFCFNVLMSEDILFLQLEP